MTSLSRFGLGSTTANEATTCSAPDPPPANASAKVGRRLQGGSPGRGCHRRGGMAQRLDQQTETIGHGFTYRTPLRQRTPQPAAGRGDRRAAPAQRWMQCNSNHTNEEVGHPVIQSTRVAPTIPVLRWRHTRDTSINKTHEHKWPQVNGRTPQPLDGEVNTYPPN